MKRLLMSYLFGMIVVLILTAIIGIVVDFVRFPECYLSTWKYQLENDIARGDTVAIEYYQNTYVENGRILFTED